jgi:hypothetical protein
MADELRFTGGVKPDFPSGSGSHPSEATYCRGYEAAGLITGMIFTNQLTPKYLARPHWADSSINTEFPL